MKEVRQVVEVQIIKPTKNINRRTGKEANQKRVAAYCRVSTDSEEQLISYKSQIAHYEGLVKANPDWELVDIYADEAVTGTSVKKRLEFQRMIQDSLEGKIDLILTKSISRFARDTLTMIEYTRKLREHGVDVFFEKENIHTLSNQWEIGMVLMSAVAQQDVETASANTKLGLKMKMKRGELVGFNGCLGFDYNKETKELSINEEEAEIVKYIFETYATGVGCHIIAKELTKRGYRTKRGNPKWGDSTVRGIVANEKYCGDLLSGKSFTVDPLSKKRLANFGESEKYYIRDHHPPIISRELFDKCQEIRKRRNVNKTQGRIDRYSRQYTFSSKIKCGFCQGGVGRRAWNAGTKNSKVVWHCILSSKHGKKNCPDSKGIHEKIIEEAFVKCFNEMCGNKEILENFLATVQEALETNDNKKELATLNRKLQQLEAKIKKLVDLHIDGAIDRDIYNEKHTALSRDKEALNHQINELRITADEEIAISEKIKEFRKLLEGKQILQEFDKEVFDSVIDHIILGGTDEKGNKNAHLLTFVFRTGISKDIDGSKKEMKGKKNKDKKISTSQPSDACGVLLATD